MNIRIITMVVKTISDLKKSSVAVISCFCISCKCCKLAYLRPSRELLEYYRKKIAEFDDEHDSMLQKLDQYKMTYEEQVCFQGQI
jgi:hypothetical protein